jgi:hypothetical protein
MKRTPMFVVAPSLTAEVRDGKFWRLFAPASTSPTPSFAVTPSGSRSMPSPALDRSSLFSNELPVPLWTEMPSAPFAATRLPWTRFPVEPLRTWTPCRALPEMLLACAVVPPTRLLFEASMTTPSKLLGAATRPGVRPMTQFSTTLPPTPASRMPFPPDAPPAPKRLTARPRTVVLPDVTLRPSAVAPAFVPSSSTAGAPAAKSGSVVPSMTTGSVTAGSGEAG